MRAAAEAEVAELRARALSIADRALDVVEEALEDKDPSVRLRASSQLLDRVLPKQQPGAAVNVVVGESPQAQISPADIIRARLSALQQAKPLPSADDLQQLPWDHGSAELLAEDGPAMSDEDWI